MNAVTVEQTGAVAWITLNRPSAMNAIGPELAGDLAQAVNKVADEPAARCVILTGTGPNFTAGGDVRFLADRLGLPREDFDRQVGALISTFGHAIEAIRAMAKPVIGAVRGAVAGGGFSLMCACDLVIASETTRCRFAYGRLGTSPDGGGSHTLPRLLGVRKAMEIALLDDLIDAPRALELGLVNRVVADADLEDSARALAQRLAEHATAAFGHTKRLLNTTAEHDLRHHLKAERTSFLANAAADDFAEALTAFLAKRTPRFTGR